MIHIFRTGGFDAARVLTGAYPDGRDAVIFRLDLGEACVLCAKPWPIIPDQRAIGDVLFSGQIDVVHSGGVQDQSQSPARVYGQLRSCVHPTGRSAAVGAAVG
jgi:hypothetical protein